MNWTKITNWIKRLLRYKANKPERVMWVWYLAKKDWTNLVNLCKNKNITRVFLANPKKESVKYLQGWGIKVHALIGAQSPLKVDRIIAEAEKYASWGLFETIHLDIEFSGKDELISYLRDFDKVMSQEHLNISVDVGTWLPKQHYDSANTSIFVCLMSYAQTSEGTIKLAEKPLKWLRVPFYVGFETIDNDQFKDISFWKLGNDAMEREMANVEEHYKYDPNFKGIVIHHYDTYKRLKE